MAKLPERYYSQYSATLELTKSQIIGKCPICKGADHIILPENMYRDCECTVKFKKLKPYIMSGMNSKHIQREMEWFKERFDKKTFNKLEILMSNIDEVYKTDLLIFPTKVTSWGASHCANQLMKAFIDANYECGIISAKSLIDLIFEFDKGKEWLEYFTEVDVLLIDELGIEFNNKMKEESFQIMKLCNVILERKHENKVTLISSNMPKLDLQKYSTTFTKILNDYFNGFSVVSTKERHTEFESIRGKITNKKVIECFDELDITPKKRNKVF